MDNLPDISLQRVSTAEVVADTLTHLIVSGSLKAGEPLRENSLSKKLGISRNSLREGIRLLEQSRLVKYEMHRGSVVSTPTVEDLEDLYRTRLHLELSAARCVPTDDEVQAIRRAFENLKQKTLTHDAIAIVMADLGLHQQIVKLLHSERIDAFYSKLCRELVFYFTVLSYEDEEYLNPQEPILHRHGEICDAIYEGRPEEAASLLSEHILLNYERLREILSAEDSSAL
jgi:DNA-binding GntR family transcriptional regulator